MVLINEKKYACATCIKGHRVSTCTHTDRPLFEVKKKGRPQTQCGHCKEKRKAGVAHVKCQCEATCGSKASPAFKEPITLAQATAQATTPSVPVADAHETRKGQPGSQATFPNGLKDVHEMAAAADALAGLTGEAATAQERKITSLLNPCNCATTGICRCCGPPARREKRPEARRAPSSEASPSGTVTPISTDQLLADMLRSKATTGSSSPAAAVNVPNWLSSSLSQAGSSHHHPAHTSPHVHKTKLYSPYTTPSSSRRHSHQTPSETSSRPRSSSKASQHSIRPLANIDTLLSAIFTPDGQAAKTIPRAALGLPGIDTFLEQAPSVDDPDAATPRQEHSDMLVDFPTSEPVDLAACTCGDECDCPGCAVHPNASSGSGTPKSAHGCCGERCTSKYDCAKHLSLPSGITSIEHLISLAASNVPPPPDRGRGLGMKIEPNDVSVLPSAHQAALDEEAARAMGVVLLEPLECCNGRCQCPPGDCSCMEDCCGCCARCLCEDETPAAGSGSGGSLPASAANAAAAPSSCCSAPAAAPTPTPTIPVLSPIPQRAVAPSASPSTGNEGGGSCCKTASTAPPVQRRSSSSLRMSQAAASRRTSVSTPQGSLQRSASTGKSTSKALALHVSANHPRLILPKPQGVPGKLSVTGVTPSTSRSASPGRPSRASSPSPSMTSSVSHTSTLPSAPTSLPSTNTSPSRADEGPLGGMADLDVNMTDADMLACFEELARDPAFQQLTSPQSGQPSHPLDQSALDAINKQQPLNMLGPYDQSTSAHHPYPQSQPVPQYGAYSSRQPGLDFYGMPQQQSMHVQQQPGPPPPGYVGNFGQYPSYGYNPGQYGPPPTNPPQPFYPPNSSPDELIAVVARLVSTGQLPPSVLSLNGGGGQGAPLDLRQILALQAQHRQAPVQHAYGPPTPLMQHSQQSQAHHQPTLHTPPRGADSLLDADAITAMLQQPLNASQYDFPSHTVASQVSPGEMTLFSPQEDAFDFEAFLQSSGPA